MINRRILHQTQVQIKEILEPLGTHALMETGFYEGGAYLPEPFGKSNVYRTRRGLEGTKARLGRRSIALCMSGYSISLHSPDIPVGPSFKVAELFFPRLEQDLFFIPEENRLLDIAAEGIHHYLNGYPPEESDDIKELVRQNEASWEVKQSGELQRVLEVLCREGLTRPQ